MARSISTYKRRTLARKKNPTGCPPKGKFILMLRLYWPKRRHPRFLTAHGRFHQ